MRAAIWRDTSVSVHAVLANRGPAYEPADQSPTADWRLLPASAQISPDFASPVGRGSNTLLIHGSRNTWEGNVAYNDNRVIFEKLQVSRRTAAVARARALGLLDP